MKSSKLLGFSLALLIGAGTITSGCSSTQPNMPNTPSVNSGTNDSSVKPNTSTPQTSNSNTNSAPVGSVATTTPNQSTPAQTTHNTSVSK